LGLLAGHYTFSGRSAVGTGVLIGEGCGLPSAGAFCGRETTIRIEVTKTGVALDLGSAGVIRVATQNGETTWPLRLGYWGGRPGFDVVMLGSRGVFELHQAEFVGTSRVLMTIYEDGRTFFQSADTGCMGNGLISAYRNRMDLYGFELEIRGCTGSFSYLNTDFEGLGLRESLTPWDYDFSVISLWLSTPPGAPSPAAITLWADPVD
jgi:hypothetical protein